MRAPDVLRQIVPDFAKRRHERWVIDRFLRRVNALNRDYVREHGLVVQRGPFAGLRYLDELVEDSGDLVAKLVGAYEVELYPVIEEWLAAPGGTVLNVGAAEGFYAVGLARSNPQLRVVAYDIDLVARGRCEALSQANGVADRVEVRGECTPGELERVASGRTMLLSDCEGCELGLLDPVAAPSLAGVDMLVELHHAVAPDIADTLRQRFEPTHEVMLIDGRSRDEVAVPELEGLSVHDRGLLLSERPEAMQWARLRPRSSCT